MFNVIEGIIDHEVLGLHHVREYSPHQLLWDLGFLGFGAALLLGGWVLLRAGCADAGR